jgi:hypothetical protein
MRCQGHLTNSKRGDVMTHAYIVERDWDEPLTIFAESVDQAASLYLTFKALKGHQEPERFSIARAARGIKDDRRREHMRTAMRRREIGIGRYDPEAGYTIVPVIDANEEGTGAPWDNLGRI